MVSDGAKHRRGAGEGGLAEAEGALEVGVAPPTERIRELLIIDPHPANIRRIFSKRQKVTKARRSPEVFVAFARFVYFCKKSAFGFSALPRVLCAAVDLPF
jgi:hypothetical protein